MRKVFEQRPRDKACHGTPRGTWHDGRQIVAVVVAVWRPAGLPFNGSRTSVAHQCVVVAGMWVAVAVAVAVAGGLACWRTCGRTRGSTHAQPLGRGERADSYPALPCCFAAPCVSASGLLTS